MSSRGQIRVIVCGKFERMVSCPIPLFCDGDLGQTLREQAAQIPNRVDSIPVYEMLHASKEDVIDLIYGEIYVEPIVLFRGSASAHLRETSVKARHSLSRWFSRDRSGSEVTEPSLTVSIPYKGDFDLWKLRPNRYKSIFPKARVLRPDIGSSGRIEILFKHSVVSTLVDLQYILNEELDILDYYLHAQRAQLDSFNGSARVNIEVAVLARKERLNVQLGAQVRESYGQK